MKTNITTTTLAAYRAGLHAGLWCRQSEELRLVIAAQKKPISRRRLSEISGKPINVVTGRCNELVGNGGAKVVDGKIKCPISGRMVEGLVA